MRCARVEGSWVKKAGDVGKGARSRIRRAGLSLIVPRRVVRRPAWSEGYTLGDIVGRKKVIGAL